MSTECIIDPSPSLVSSHRYVGPESGNFCSDNYPECTSATRSIKKHLTHPHGKTSPPARSTFYLVSLKTGTRWGPVGGTRYPGTVPGYQYS